MPKYSVKVKWNRDLHAVDMNTDESTDTFKAQLYALTGVPADRQKIMFKARQLGATWDKFPVAALKDGVQLTMMGSSDGIPQTIVAGAASESAVDEKGVKVEKPPAGLVNIGNTCYMNATVQCLAVVPELKQALDKYNINTAQAMTLMATNRDPTPALTSCMRDLVTSLQLKSGETLPPVAFLKILHAACPQFNTQDSHGHPEQQDAAECWTELVRRLQQAKLAPSDKVDAVGDFVTQYFGIKMDSELKCTESEEEPTIASTEEFLMFSCFINQDVKYLASGLKAKLTEELTKHCATLNRDALWSKTSKLSRVPAYMTVNLMRFFYKEKEKTNAKVLKDIKFPMTLDVIDMCSDALKLKLLPGRDASKKADDAKLDRLARIKSGRLDEATVDTWRTEALPYAFDDDAGSSNTGLYDLCAVLTHKGRSSNSGHYVAWVRRGAQWFMCDDEHVLPCAADDIERLSGGGDWHCAYVLLYAPKIITIVHEPTDAESAATTTAAEGVDSPMDTASTATNGAPTTTTE